MTIKGLQKRLHVEGTYVWYIDKRVRRYGRLCESTGTDNREEAERYLLHRLHELREVFIYGERPTRTFQDAIQKYESAFGKKKSIKRDSAVLQEMVPFIGNLPLGRISDASFDPYRRAQRHVSIRTRNQKLALAGRVLRLAATVWCFTDTNLTWIDRAPEILTESGHRARTPYPLNPQEQQLLLSELDSDAVQTATFAVNTGARDGELCRLQWNWERRVVIPGRARGWSSVFVLPGEVVKNGEPRALILNDAAQDILESVRGRHRRFVFVSNRHQQPFSRLYAAGWRGARRRAAERYPEWFGTEAPKGFRRVRVHDLRHTFGRRLRAAGVSLEDRRDLLGHKGPEITTLYSAAEIGRLVEAANRILGSHETSTPSVRQVIEG